MKLDSGKKYLLLREGGKEQVTDSKLASEMPHYQVFKLPISNLGWVKRESTAKNKTMNGFFSKKRGMRRQEV